MRGQFTHRDIFRGTPTYGFRQGILIRQARSLLVFVALPPDLMVAWGGEVLSTGRAGSGTP